MENKNKLFIDKIEFHEINNIKSILNEIYSGNKKIEDLTIRQKKDIYNFLTVEVVKKEIKLKNVKNQLFYEKIKENKDINEILALMSERDKKSFIEYLNKK